MNLFLRHDGFDVPIMPGSMVVGRASDCQLVLTSSRVSRKHAMFTLTAAGLSVHDLGSANGVFVNGSRINKRTALDPGDEVMLGDEVLSVVPGKPRIDRLSRATLPGGTDTLPGVQAPVVGAEGPQIRISNGTTSEPTVRTDVLSLIAKLADKMLAIGKPLEAERVLRPRLRQVLSHAHADQTVPEDIAEAAARHAVKLAEAKKDPEWVEYTFELYTALQKPLPQEVIEQLYTILRIIPPIRMDSLRRYVRALDAASHGFPPGQRFLVKRIRGLEGLASAR